VNMTIMTFHKDTEETDELQVPVANIERDSEQYVTIYGEEIADAVPYIVLDQDVLDELQQLQPQMSDPTEGPLAYAVSKETELFTLKRQGIHPTIQNITNLLWSYKKKASL